MLILIPPSIKLSPFRCGDFAQTVTWLQLLATLFSVRFTNAAPKPTFEEVTVRFSVVPQAVAVMTTDLNSSFSCIGTLTSIDLLEAAEPIGRFRHVCAGLAFRKKTSVFVVCKEEEPPGLFLTTYATILVKQLDPLMFIVPSQFVMVFLYNFSEVIAPVNLVTSIAGTLLPSIVMELGSVPVEQSANTSTIISTTFPQFGITKELPPSCIPLA